MWSSLRHYEAYELQVLTSVAGNTVILPVTISVGAVYLYRPILGARDIDGGVGDQLSVILSDRGERWRSEQAVLTRSYSSGHDD